MNWGKQAIVLVLLFATAAWAGGEWPPQGEDDPKIEVRVKPQHARAHCTHFLVSVVIEDHSPITLGEHEIIGEHPWQRNGIAPDTVRVRLLKGTPDLHLIEWLGFSGGGSGNIMPYCYRISKASDPAKVLASGTLMLHGKGGLGFSHAASSRITYEEDRLTIAESFYDVSTTTQPQPLHHFVPAKGDFWQSQQQTKVERTFKITKDGAELKHATFQYRVQKGDQRDDVLSVFKLESDWVAKPTLPMPGVWLTADVPADVAIERWPTIEE